MLGSFIVAHEVGQKYRMMYISACRGSRGLPTVLPDLWKSKILHKKALLAELGYTDEDLDPRVPLNIDYARANVKSLIYDQAVLEGISTAFPQTDAILENGIVNGVRAQDVQKILNPKHAWEFVLDKDVLRSDTDFYIRRPERHNTVYERKCWRQF